MLGTFVSWWKLGSKDRCPKLKDFALKIHSKFGNIYSAYVRESTFSTMKQVKFINRNRMTDETLVDSRRLATTNTGIDKGMIVSEVSTRDILLIEIVTNCYLVLCNNFENAFTYPPFFSV